MPLIQLSHDREPAYTTRRAHHGLRFTGRSHLSGYREFGPRPAPTADNPRPRPAIVPAACCAGCWPLNRHEPQPARPAGTHAALGTTCLSAGLAAARSGRTRSVIQPELRRESKIIPSRSAVSAILRAYAHNIPHRGQAQPDFSPAVRRESKRLHELGQQNLSG